jgi:hypothetical protein
VIREALQASDQRFSLSSAYTAGLMDDWIGGLMITENEVGARRAYMVWGF